MTSYQLRVYHEGISRAELIPIFIQQYDIKESILDENGDTPQYNADSIWLEEESDVLSFSIEYPQFTFVLKVMYGNSIHKYEVSDGIIVSQSHKTLSFDDI